MPRQEALGRNEMPSFDTNETAPILDARVPILNENWCKRSSVHNSYASYQKWPLKSKDASFTRHQKKKIFRNNSVTSEVHDRQPNTFSYLNIIFSIKIIRITQLNKMRCVFIHCKQMMSTASYRYLCSTPKC